MVPKQPNVALYARKTICSCWNSDVAFSLKILLKQNRIMPKHLRRSAKNIMVSTRLEPLCSCCWDLDIRRGKMLWMFLGLFFNLQCRKRKEGLPIGLENRFATNWNIRKNRCCQAVFLEKSQSAKGVLGSKNGFFHAKNISRKWTVKTVLIPSKQRRNSRIHLFLIFRGVSLQGEHFQKILFRSQLEMLVEGKKFVADICC